MTSNRTAQYLDVLSNLTLHGDRAGSASAEALLNELEAVSAFNEDEWAEFLRLSSIHHVTVRALQSLQQAAEVVSNDRLMLRVAPVLEDERQRIFQAIERLAPIQRTLEDGGCPTTVIKSLDHWPDLGSDLDLYTSGTPEQVVQLMSAKFHAQLEPRSWGDRLANKWNFAVPGLPELVEIHVRYLGQTGEQTSMARRVISRRVGKALNGHRFQVPAPEERVMISTLQRMYRHFYFRLCDMVDFAALLRSGAIDFVELRRGAELGRIWPGVATFLLLVHEYATKYEAEAPVPPEVLAASPSPDARIFVGGDFLRVPKGPAAGLYGSQLLRSGLHGDIRAALRLSLLPPLAVSALVAYRLSGSDKGIW